MKKFAFVLFALALLVAGCSENTPSGVSTTSQDMFSESAFQTTDQAVTSELPKIGDFSVTSLTPDEAAGLTFMREEEKVARDVYIKMYEKWGLIVFNNISKSEQVHMNALKAMLTYYNIPDPVVDNTVGVFTNPDLQALYNALMERANVSAQEALIVGRDIEITDIADLDEQLNNVVVSANLSRVYTNLKRGSNFHLNAFNYWISLGTK